MAFGRHHARNRREEAREWDLVILSVVNMLSRDDEIPDSITPPNPDIGLLTCIVPDYLVCALWNHLAGVIENGNAILGLDLDDVGHIASPYCRCGIPSAGRVRTDLRTDVLGGAGGQESDLNIPRRSRQPLGFHGNYGLPE
jgi:hypothetical protein